MFWLYYFPLKFFNRLDDLKYWNQNISNQLEKKKREVSCQAGLRACSIAYNGRCICMWLDDEYTRFLCWQHKGKNSYGYLE